MNAPAKLEDVVIQRIQPIIAELLPEDQLRKIVSEQISRMHLTLIQEVLTNELKTRTQKALQDELAKPEWRELWVFDGGNGSYGVGPALQKIIEDAAPTLVRSMFEGMVSQVIMNIRNNPHLLR